MTKPMLFTCFFALVLKYCYLVISRVGLIARYSRQCTSTIAYKNKAN
jgi:hypothetical protein